MLADVNENDGTGHTNLGIPRSRTKSVRYAMAKPEEFTGYPSLCTQLGRPEGRRKNLFLLASDPGRTDEMDEKLFGETLLKLWGYLHTIFIDGGNGNNSAGNTRSVKIATNLIISTLADDPTAFEKAISTMAAHYNRGEATKVKRSFIAVNATKPDDDTDKYYDMLVRAVSELRVEDVSDAKHVQREFTLEDLGITPESIYLIPFDQHIKNRGVADVPSLQLDTLIAYLELLVAIFGQEIPPNENPSVPAESQNNTERNNHV
jgi:hypothetical protein